MNTLEFCYWLKGFLDSNDNITCEKITVIKSQLEETLNEHKRPKPTQESSTTWLNNYPQGS